MATVELSSIPEEIRAGDSVSWRKSFSSFPASDGWSLLYALVMEGQQIKITSAADGDDHLIDLSSDDTKDYAPGSYKYEAYLKKGAERYTVAEGFVTIAPNLEAAMTGYDARPFCYRLRDALEAALEGRASETQTAISIKDRTISEMSHEELDRALMSAKRKVMNYERNQRIKQGQPSGATVKVRFS